MLTVTDTIAIPDTEFTWTFVRASGPGGQNVNKVASKAVLRWDAAGTPSLPDAVKEQLLVLFQSRLTNDGFLLVTSQRFRDQDRNRQDCLEKLADMIRSATVRPKVRRPTKPSRGSKERRLEAKRHRQSRKEGRRSPPND